MAVSEIYEEGAEQKVYLFISYFLPFFITSAEGMISDQMNRPFKYSNLIRTMVQDKHMDSAVFEGKTCIDDGRKYSFRMDIGDRSITLPVSSGPHIDNPWYRNLSRVTMEVTRF